MIRYSIGDTGSFGKTITETDVYLFAGICGDFNPLHINKEIAGQSRYGRQIVHGSLLNSFISTVLGMYMPGQGSIYIEQCSKFIHPVFIGDTITAKVKILEIDERNNAVLDTKIYNQNDILVVDGKARVKLPEPSE